MTSKTNLDLVREVCGDEAAERIVRARDANPELADRAARLTMLFERMTERESFRPGDLVEWKPGLRNGPGDVLVVTEVLDDAVQPRVDIPMQFDVVLGTLDGESDLILFYAEAYRLQTWRQAQANDTEDRV